MTVEIEALLRSVEEQARSIEDLRTDLAANTKAIEKRTSAVERQAKAARRSSFRVQVVLVALTAAILLVVPATVKVALDNRDAIEESQRRWCPVVAPLAPKPGDPPPQGTPEQQERALRIRSEFSKLVRDFGCL